MHPQTVQPDCESETMITHNESEFDVAVFGGGPAGLSAAIACARRGHRVLLAEQNGYLGGNAALGLPFLGYLDLAGRRIVGGIAQEYIDRLCERGAALGHRACPKHNSVTNFKPQEFKLLAAEMCREAGVELLLHAEAADARTEGNRVEAVELAGRGIRHWVRARQFIDCTGDGSVAAMAGCGFEQGADGTREVQPPTVMFTLERVDTARLYDYIEQHPDEMTYAATIDHRPGYDAAYFRRSANHVFVGLRTTFSRLRAAGKCPVERETLIFINSLNPGEVFVNSTRLLGTDTTDLRSLTRAELDGQLQARALTEMLRENVPGFADCFLSEIQPAIGIRESRRLHGIATLREDQVLAGEIPEDTIALGGYKIDIHSGKDRTTLFRTVTEPFGIPYGILVSRDRSNLLFAGRCVSCDRGTLASIRVMPQCMNMGEAAGIGAALALEQDCTPAKVSTAEVRRLLLANGAILGMDQVRIHPEDRMD